MEEAKIILDNNRSRLLIDRVSLDKIREATKIRKPGAYYSPAYGKHWDGYVRYISDATGSFSTGLLPMFIKELWQLNIDYVIDDRRILFKDHGALTNFSNGDEIRDYQLKGANFVLNNRVERVRFQRGILHFATNAGKSYIAASIFGAYSDKRKGLLLIDNTEIFPQLYKDLCDLLGSDQVGRINPRYCDVNKRVTVAMVQTLSNRIKKDRKIKKWLEDMDIVLVDEADSTALKKVGKHCLSTCLNAPVRIGLSGTVENKKDKTKFRELVAFFGPILGTISNKELVDLGVSTPPVISILTGNKEVSCKDYAEEYDLGISTNRKRHRRIWKRVAKHIAKGRVPILIMTRYRKHIASLLKCCPKEITDLYKVDWAHGERKDKSAVIERFKKGKIDILITSKIINRGKNLPLIRALINAAGGDSHTVLLQLFGRALRSHKSKKKVYVDDFMDAGMHLQKHSKHRSIYYKNEGFGIKELWKKIKSKQLKLF